MREYFTAICLVFVVVLAGGCDPQRDGPAPKIASVVPEVVCTAQAEVILEITGTGFSPAVGNALTDKPKILMPTVWLVASGNTPTKIPDANVVLTRGAGGEPDLLTATVPQELVPPTAAGEAEVQYGVRVKNPNGNQDTHEPGVLVVPPPSLESVDPALGAQNSTVTITLTGTGFREGMIVTLDADPAVMGTNVVVESSTTATADLDLTGVALGTYSITVTNPEGCSATLENAFEVTEPETFMLLGIEPPFGWTGAPTPVTIFSDNGFVSTPTAFMRLHDDPDAEPVEFERVAFIDASTLTAVVPEGAEIGMYDVTVTNPPSSGTVGFLENGFRVVSQPTPRIFLVVPNRGSTQEDTDVVIYGENFRNPVRIELIDFEGEIAVTIDDVNPTSDTQIDTVFPTDTLSADLPVGPYLVRVTNMDEETYYTWSAFLVTNPSGNLNVFTETESLSTGRRMLAGLFAYDDLASRYVYGIGGDTGADGEVLDTVELSQLSAFGDLGTWREQRYLLNTPRVAASAIAVPVYDPDGSPFIPIKTYIYVVGGLDDTGTVLDSIERGMVLPGNDAPRITDSDIDEEAGNLETGTWYYMVSAMMDAADPDNPSGETLPSDEEIVTLSAPGSITISWDAVQINGLDAVGYRVYRTDEPNGASQSEHLIAEVTETTFTDTGEDAGTEAPLFAGSTGVFVEESGTLGTPRWGHQALLIHDDAGANFLFVLGGKQSEVDGVLDTAELAAIDEDGLLGALGSAGTTPLTEGRAFFSAVVEDQLNVAAYPDEGSRVWAMGGLIASGGTTNELEESDVTTGGGNGAWTINGHTMQDAAGTMSVIANNKLFILGGCDAADTVFSGVTPNGRDTEFDDAGDISGSINSTASSLLNPRALGIGLYGAGFIYFYGGTSDGTDALATTELTY